MTEFEKQVPKEGYQSCNAKFMGLDSEPLTGKSDKGAWRKVKLRFLLDGKSKENKFVLWTPIATKNTKYRSDEDLKQFGRYNIVWVEKDESHDGNEWVSKTITNLHDEEDDKIAPSIPKIQEETVTESNSDSPLSILYTDYMALCNINKRKPTYTEFIGHYVRKKLPDAEFLKALKGYWDELNRR